MQGCIPLLRQTGGFYYVKREVLDWSRLDRGVARRKDCPQPAGSVLGLDLDWFEGLPMRRYARRRAARTGDPRTGASCARSALAKGVFGAGDEDAGAAGLAPDALVARSGRTVVVVAREELALVDPQLPSRRCSSSTPA
jgi:hypothetical protein